MRLYAKRHFRVLLDDRGWTFGNIYGGTMVIDSFDLLCQLKSPKRKFNQKKKQARARTGRR